MALIRTLPSKHGQLRCGPRGRQRAFARRKSIKIKTGMKFCALLAACKRKRDAHGKQRAQARMTGGSRASKIQTPNQTASENLVEKNVTPAVVEANRANARKSTGPRTAAGKRNSSRNAMKFGLLTRRIAFEDPQQQKDFEALKSWVWEECAPKGGLEQICVDDIVACLWKLQSTENLTQGTFSTQSKTSSTILKLFMNSSCRFDRPLAGELEQLQSLGGPAVACREIIVSVDGRSTEGKEGSRTDSTENCEKAQMQAKLEPGGDAILRYGAAWRRELYRAMNTFYRLRSRSRRQR